MTLKETTLLKQNFKMNLVTILTLIGCTATFVWKGAEYSNEIKNTVSVHSADIIQIKKDVQDQKKQTAQLYENQTRHELRIFGLEQRIK